MMNRNRFQKLLLLTLSLFTVFTMMAISAPLNLTIMTYNIQHGLGRDNQVDLNRIARIILKENPDLVAVQEIYGGGPSFGNQVDQLAGILTQQAGTKWQGVFRTNLDFSRGQYGNAIFSPHSILTVENIHLPRIPVKNEPRGCLKTTILIKKKKVDFFTTHLAFQGFATTERIQSMDTIIQWMKASNQPQFLVGDFNSEIKEECHQLLKQSGFDDTWGILSSKNTPGYTWPADAPHTRIDYIYYPAQPSSKPVSISIPESREVIEASDHRPVVARFIWSDKKIH